MESINLPWDKLTSVTTDGAAAMIGRNAGFIGSLKSKFIRQSKQEIRSIHYKIHQEAVCKLL